MRDFREFKKGSLTESSADAWKPLKPKEQIERLGAMALMFEARLSELDPHYRAYPYGRIEAPDSKVLKTDSNAMQMIALEPI